MSFILAVPKEVGKTSENSPDFIHPISQRRGNIASFFAKQEEKSPAKKPTSSSMAKPVKQERRSSSPPKPDTVKRKFPHEEHNAGESQGQTKLDGALRPSTPPKDSSKQSDSDVEVLKDTSKVGGKEPPAKKGKAELS